LVRFGKAHGRYSLVGVISAETILTVWDFVVEIAARKDDLGDEYAGERVTHSIMAILYGAMLATLIPTLSSWWGRPTGLSVIARVPNLFGRAGLSHVSMHCSRATEKECSTRRSGDTSKTFQVPSPSSESEVQMKNHQVLSLVAAGLLLVENNYDFHHTELRCFESAMSATRQIRADSGSSGSRRTTTIQYLPYSLRRGGRRP
jgi:hypothetical protein